MFEVFETATGKTVAYVTDEPNPTTLGRELDYDPVKGFFVEQSGPRAKHFVTRKFDDKASAQRFAEFQNQGSDFYSFSVVEGN